MVKKIFKVGSYGDKGTYSKEKLNSWVGKEFNITAGHIGDWEKAGYPKTAIPIAGTCKAIGVDEKGFLLGEFNYNSFGEKIKDSYPNLSIGIGHDGNPNHLAILGYAPPHLKDLDKSFSEFSKDLSVLDGVNIEFSEEEPKPKEIDLSKIDLEKLTSELKSRGYTVNKEAKKPEFSEEEIYEKVKAEFTREQEKKEVLAKFKKIPPVLKPVIEFAIEKAFSETEYNNVIEFSETEKVSMASKLKEFSKDENPFNVLFKSLISEFSEETPQDKAKRLAEMV